MARGPFESFAFSVNEPGFARLQVDRLTIHGTLDLAPNTRIQNILGFRELHGESLTDLDALPVDLLRVGTDFDIVQVSNELRLETEFEDFLNVNLGAYFLSQNIEFREQRTFPSTMADVTQGGDQSQVSLAGFAELRLSLIESLSVFGGARITYERNPSTSPMRAAVPSVKTVTLISVTAQTGY